MNFNLLEQSCSFYSEKWQLENIQNAYSVKCNNEHSTTKSSNDIRKSLKYFQKQSDLTSNNVIECSDTVRLSDNQVVMTRLEDNTLIDNERCYTLALSQMKEEYKMNIENPEAQKWIRKMGKMDETPDDVIIRVLSQAYACDLCCNLE